jgi:hypothetical protein
MATTIYFAIKADSAMLVQLADGSFQLQILTDHPEEYKGNPLVVWTSDQDWKLCPENWKTSEGQARHVWWGHEVSKIALTPKVEVIK